MAQGWTAAAPQLRQRARAIAALIQAHAHPVVSNHLKHASATLTACADLVEELRPAVVSYVDRKAGIASSTRPGEPAAEREQLGVAALQSPIDGFSVVVAGVSTSVIFGAAVDLSNGKDREAAKALILQIGAVTAEFAMKLSGIDLLMHAADVMGGVESALDTRKKSRLRSRQARAASALLLWIDGAAYAGAVWCYGAQGFLMAITNGTPPAAAEVEAAVMKRIDEAMISLT